MTMNNNGYPSTAELGRVYLFESLDQEQLERMRQSARALSLNAKESLFEFGQAAHRFYFVRKGQIKLFRLSADGDEKVMEVIQPGNTFAEAIMFMQRHNYPVSAEAIEPSELLSFDMQVFVELLQNSIPTCFRLMADMSQRLHARIEEINNITLQNATHRLVEYLLRQLPEETAEASSVHLSTPKSVIASKLSIQPETLSRILARLSKNGLISVQGSNITLHDVHGLRVLL